MKKSLLFVLLIISFSAFSQQDAWVYFNAKPNSSTYLSNPLSMLTQRALDRRTAQGISLDVSDVPIYQPYIDQITSSTGISVYAKSKWLNCLHIRGSQSDIMALSALSFVDHIRFADNALNLKMTIPKLVKPVNKKFDINVSYNYGNSFNQIQMLNGHLLHQQNYTGEGKIIAVLDAGFPGVNTAQPFQRLFDNNLVLGGYDFVNKNTDFYTGNAHGTMVLSTMGGYTDGQLVGTAPNAGYYLFITEDVNSENPVEESNWVEAAEEADRLGVDIINSSLGYFEYDNPAYSHNYSDMTGNTNFASQGANMAFSKGIVVVASAGNNAESVEPHVGVPAEALHVLAIGAVTNMEAYATFSSIGPSFDGRVKPDVVAQGQSSVVSYIDGAIVTGSGTSFSGPIMAGMIASFWQAVPTLTNQQIIDVVKQSANKFTTPDIYYGYGIPNFQLALTNALAVKSFYNTTFTLYPNPVQDSISLGFPDAIENTTFTLFNLLGQTILEKKATKSDASVSLESIHSGVYYYKIESNTYSQSGKIIKK
jgi:serine protease AprX